MSMIDRISPHPPAQRAPSKWSHNRRRSVASGGPRPSMSSQSRSGLYSSGMYSSKIMRSGMHLAGDKHQAAAVGKTHQVRVYDEQGNDVTPEPLLPVNKAMPHRGGDRTGAGAHRVSQESATDFLNNLETNTMASNFNSSSFCRSAMFGSSKASGASMAERDDDETSSMASVDSDVEGEDAARDYGVKPKAVKHWTEAELAAPVSVVLSETDTIWLLELPGTVVASDSPEEASVRACNERYKQLKASRRTNENFVERGTQTFNYFSKNKDVQATILKQVNAECMVTDWSIYDTYAAVEEKYAETTDAEQDSTAAGLFLADDGPTSSETQVSVGPARSSSTMHMRSQSQASYM